MKIDKTYFDREVIRRHSGCYKWDEAEDDDVIPMWVADMDFRTAPCIIDALHERVEHGVFGYTLVGDEYYDAVMSWWQRRHGWQIEREWIQYTSGVVPALSVIIKALCQSGDKVIVLTPVYNCFFSSIRNNGCEALCVPLLRKNLSDEEFTYEIDFPALERACADEKAKLLLFCNPHNPAGRVWTMAEIAHLNDVCVRNGVRVVSDEIHCELVMPGNRFIPFASVSDACLNNSVTCNSPSKSFNTAGLQIANIICNHPGIRERIDRTININEVCDVNPFGVVGLVAAYNEGETWLEALNAYLHDNYVALRNFLHTHCPHLSCCRLEGTYLAWVDISSLDIDADSLCDRILRECKVQLNSGTMYDAEYGKSFIRLNLACPQSQLNEALERIRSVLAENVSAK